jgi:hypothetical protein
MWREKVINHQVEEVAAIKALNLFKRTQILIFTKEFSRVIPKIRVRATFVL